MVHQSCGVPTKGSVCWCFSRILELTTCTACPIAQALFCAMQLSVFQKRKHFLESSISSCHRTMLTECRLLSLYCCLGMLVTKIHKVIRFRQVIIFGPYIEMNIKRCIVAETQFEKNVTGLYCNAEYGHCLLCPEKFRSIKLPFRVKEAERYEPSK